MMQKDVENMRRQRGAIFPQQELATSHVTKEFVAQLCTLSVRIATWCPRIRRVSNCQRPSGPGSDVAFRLVRAKSDAVGLLDFALCTPVASCRSDDFSNYVRAKIWRACRVRAGGWVRPCVPRRQIAILLENATARLG